jgi:hypothetical protein
MSSRAVKSAALYLKRCRFIEILAFRKRMGWLIEQHFARAARHGVAVVFEIV